MTNTSLYLTDDKNIEISGKNHWTTAKYLDLFLEMPSRYAWEGFLPLSMLNKQKLQETFVGDNWIFDNFDNRYGFEEACDGTEVGLSKYNSKFYEDRLDWKIKNMYPSLADEEIVPEHVSDKFRREIFLQYRSGDCPHWIEPVRAGLSEEEIEKIKEDDKEAMSEMVPVRATKSPVADSLNRQIFEDCQGKLYGFQIGIPQLKPVGMCDIKSHLRIEEIKKYSGIKTFSEAKAMSLIYEKMGMDKDRQGFNKVREFNAAIRETQANRAWDTVISDWETLPARAARVKGISRIYNRKITPMIRKMIVALGSEELAVEWDKNERESLVTPEKVIVSAENLLKEFDNRKINENQEKIDKVFEILESYKDWDELWSLGRLDLMYEVDKHVPEWRNKALFKELFPLKKISFRKIDFDNEDVYRDLSTGEVSFDRIINLRKSPDEKFEDPEWAYDKHPEPLTGKYHLLDVMIGGGPAKNEDYRDYYHRARSFDRKNKTYQTIEVYNQDQSRRKSVTGTQANADMYVDPEGNFYNSLMDRYESGQLSIDDEGADDVYCGEGLTAKSELMFRDNEAWTYWRSGIIPSRPDLAGRKVSLHKKFLKTLREAETANQLKKIADLHRKKGRTWSYKQIDKFNEVLSEVAMKLAV